MPNTLTTNSTLLGKRGTKYQIIRRTENAPEVVHVGGKDYKMGSAGMMINDPGVAREIHEQHHGKDLLVAPIEKRPEPGQRRSFLVKLPANYKRETHAD